MKVLYMGQAPYRYLQADFGEHYESVVTTPYYELVEPEKVSRVALVLRRGAAARGARGLRRDRRQRAQPVELRHLAEPEPRRGDRRPHDAGRGALDRDQRARPLARQVARAAEDRRGVRGARHAQRRPPDRRACRSGSATTPTRTAASRRSRRAPATARAARCWRRRGRRPSRSRGTASYSRYPSVNIWPRPVQQPRPPFWVPGLGDAEHARRTSSTARTSSPILSWFGATLTGRRIFDRYWDLADEKGRDRNPYRAAFLQTVMVADTDAEAERLYGEHVQRHFRNALGAIPAAVVRAARLRRAGGDRAHHPRPRRPRPRPRSCRRSPSASSSTRAR